MSRTAFFAFLSYLFLVTSPADAGNWSVGSHFSAGSVRSRQGQGGSGVFTVPSNALTYQPGLRIAFANQRRTHEIHVDGGAMVIDQAGSTLSLVVASLGYQYVFARASLHGPYANAGIGFLREGGAAHVSVNTSYTTALGFRRVVAEGHGAFRGEMHLDYVRGDDFVDRPNLTTLGVRVGFDLWL